MPPVAAPSLLARLTRPRRRSLRQQEPADLGTAFGMELWLDERDHGHPAAPARRSWWPRWLHGGARR
ncbi:MAG: hypothetical protein JNL87_06060 [Burkholderiaceae bacterium]|nr:hypothetical protein [Burkholderiaceae bacterium]